MKEYEIDTPNYGIVKFTLEDVIDFVEIPIPMTRFQYLTNAPLYRQIIIKGYDNPMTDCIVRFNLAANRVDEVFNDWQANKVIKVEGC